MSSQDDPRNRDPQAEHLSQKMGGVATSAAQVLPRAPNAMQAAGALQIERAMAEPAPRKFALVAGGTLKSTEDPVDNFSDDMAAAIAFFRSSGYSTSALYGDPKYVEDVQKPGYEKVVSAYGEKPEPFDRAHIVMEMTRIAASVQKGDEVVLMIDSHGFANSDDEPEPKNWDDPKSGHFAFLFGMPGPGDAPTKRTAPDPDVSHREMHLDELDGIRDQIEKRGAKMVTLLFTCTSQFGMGFGNRENAVISETGTDVGNGNFSKGFLEALRPGMTPEQAYRAGRRQMLKDDPRTSDDPHVSTLEQRRAESGFKF